MEDWFSGYRRRRRQRSARREREWGRTLIAEARNTVCVHDLDGHIVDVNDYACETLGYRREELIGRPLWDVEVGLEREDILRVSRKLEPGVPQTAQGIHRRRDGATFPIEVRVVRLDSGRIFGICQDISERQRAEADAARLEARSLHAQKMEAIGTLAGGMAHDVSNHLLAIRLHTELAMAALPEGNPGARNLEQALKAAEHSTDLIKQVMTFSRSGAGSRRVTALGSLVEDVIRLLKPTFPQTIDVATNLVGTDDAVVVDAAQIQQVLMNLLANAVQAMGRGGRIEIGVHGVDLDDDAVASLKPGAYVLLTLSDTGMGIDAATLARIFEPFFTTKEVGRGAGMGLSVVHGIVTGHGGAVAVDSEPGRGTTFRLYFPRAKSTTLEANMPRLATSRPARVLFVDDDYIVASGGRQTLELLGYDVSVRMNPEDALTDVIADPNAFDVVITDQRMPRMSGTELAGEITRLNPALPVILCVSYEGEVSVADAEAIGIRRVLHKPIGIEGYSEAIDEVLQTHSDSDSMRSATK